MVGNIQKLIDNLIFSRRKIMNKEPEQKKSFFQLVSGIQKEETKEVDLPRFPGIKWLIKPITTEELKQARQKYQATGDNIGFSETLVINCTINPETQQLLWRDANAIAEYKVTTPVALLNRILRVGEIETLSAKILSFSGFESSDSIASKVKSF